MVSSGGRAGAVRLPAGVSDPELGTVNDWCLVVDGPERMGIGRQAEVLQRTQVGQLRARARVLSGAASAWFTLEELSKLEPPAPVEPLVLLPLPHKRASTVEPRSRARLNRFCAQCGAEQEPDARCCSACGRRLRPPGEDATAARG